MYVKVVGMVKSLSGQHVLTALKVQLTMARAMLTHRIPDLASY